MTQVPPLPLETAKRIARAALSSLDVALRVDDAIAPSFAWVCVAPPSQQLAVRDGARKIRESLRVLTALSACNGFSLAENVKFWSGIWPPDPEVERQQPQWAHKWKQLHLRERPVPSTRQLQFLFPLEGTKVGGRARYATIADVEQLILVDEGESAGFRLTMDVLSRHIEDDKWPLMVQCGLEVTNADPNRWSRLLKATKHRESNQMTKMFMPFQLTECLLSTRDCLRHSRTLKDVAAAFQPMGGLLPVKELQLDFGWSETEKSWEKRLCGFRQLIWNVASESEGEEGLRVLELTGGCISDASYFGVLCSALPHLRSLQELRLEMRPIVQKDLRRLIWHWIALTMFHPQSNVTIRHLDLSQCDVSVGDVGVVIDVMDNEWNSAMLMLLDYEHDSSFEPIPKNEIHIALVQANTRVEAEPAHRFFSKPLAILARDEQFMVVFSLPDWVCVYLPGLGRGFIKRRSVVSTTRRPTFPSSQNSGLKSLKLTTTKIWPTLELLQKIGTHLEDLNLECEAFTNIHLKQLLDSCPRLTNLTLRSGELNDFSSLVDASVAGTCKVSSLDLYTRTITTSCVEHLVKKLSIPTLAATSCVRELRLHTGLLKREDFEAFLQLLKANRTLRCLHIKIAFDLFDEFMPGFLDHRGDWLEGGEEDKQKLAFLSVISTCRTEASDRQKIDSTMLGRIFAFAFEGERLISLDEYTDMMTIQEVERRANAA